MQVFFLFLFTDFVAERCFLGCGRGSQGTGMKRVRDGGGWGGVGQVIPGSPGVASGPEPLLTLLSPAAFMFCSCGSGEGCRGSGWGGKGGLVSRSSSALRSCPQEPTARLAAPSHNAALPPASPSAAS